MQIVPLYPSFYESIYERLIMKKINMMKENKQVINLSYTNLKDKR
jgi:hypothetical protein